MQTPEQKREYQRKWISRNRDHVRKCNRDSYYKFRDKRLEYQRELRLSGKRKRYPDMDRYYAIRMSARKNNRDFDITYDQYVGIIIQPCLYCGEETLPRGIDRIDSSGSYTHGNMVACCWECNYMKRDMSYERFIWKCRIIGEMNPPTLHEG